MRPDHAHEAARPSGLVASYSSYAEVQAAVGRLADRRFPVQRLSVAANGRLVEGAGRRAGTGLASAAGTGALSGAAAGLALGVVGWLSPLVPVLWAMVVGFVGGALAGVTVGLVVYLVDPEPWRSSLLSSLQADRFELLSDRALAGTAARLLDDDGG